VNGKHYGVAKVSDVEDGRYRILVLITMPITQHLICSVSGFMLCLSRFQAGRKWGPATSVRDARDNVFYRVKSRAKKEISDVTFISPGGVITPAIAAGDIGPKLSMEGAWFILSTTCPENPLLRPLA